MIFVFLMGISSLKNDPLANGDEYRTLAHIFSERLDSPQPLPITIANPQTMGGVFQWMHNYYRSCGRTVDNANEVIERFVRDSDPC